MPSSASCSGIDRLQSCAILTKARSPAAAATASFDAGCLTCAGSSVVLIAVSRWSTYMDLSYQKYINGQYRCTKIRQVLAGPGAALKTPAVLARIWCNSPRGAHLDGAVPRSAAAKRLIFVGRQLGISPALPGRSAAFQRPGVDPSARKAWDFRSVASTTPCPEAI